ncbi:DUF5692 family protein [Gemmata sp.]|uniref:DUF5692 family protein n=1 Tax=Gemmata sp. TaxID=1914242 RepID=UPI003F7011B7
MPVALKILALFAALYVTFEVLRRAGKWAAWALFLAVPLALTPYWVRVNSFDPFCWLKLYTVCFCVVWGTALRFTRLGDRAWARLGIPVLLAGNIIEAMVTDLIGGGLAHELNAAAGLLLVATQPYARRATRVDTTGEFRDLRYGLTRGWVVAYTVWNWAFVYLNYPALVGQHTAVLACGLVVAAYDPRLWVQARAFTLGLILVATATIDAALRPWLDTSAWSDERAGVAVAGAALAVAIGSAAGARRGRAAYDSGADRAARGAAQCPTRRTPTVRTPTPPRPTRPNSRGPARPGPRSAGCSAGSK